MFLLTIENKKDQPIRVIDLDGVDQTLAPGQSVMLTPPHERGVVVSPYTSDGGPRTTCDLLLNDYGSRESRTRRGPCFFRLKAGGPSHWVSYYRNAGWLTVTMESEDKFSATLVTAGPGSPGYDVGGDGEPVEVCRGVLAPLPANPPPAGDGSVPAITTSRPELPDESDLP